MGHGHHDNSSQRIYRLLFLTLTFLELTLVESSKNFDYEWRTGPWGKCELSGCGFGGVRRRTVWCSHKTGWTTLFSHCHFIPAPSDTESCFKVCEEHRDEVTWVPSLWSDCQTETPGGECVRLGGYRSRQVLCVYQPSDSALEDIVCEFFQSKPPQRQSCELKCHQDCVLSRFSEWSVCNGCFHLYSRRTRRVVVAPQSGGRPCGALVEKELCSNCTDTYRFQVNPWSPCLRSFQFKNPKKNERSHLLIGYQKRDIYCVNSKGGVVGHRYCLDNLHLPDLRNVRSCTMPQDCQVSDWMEWQPINSSCLADNGLIIPGYMSRIRRVRQLPLGHGARCPPLTNTFQVVGDGARLHRCPRYNWTLSSWSECELLYQSRKRAERCGPGVHTRAAFCVKLQDSIEVVVDSKFCPEHPPIVSKQCHIPCTQNCTVSHWSDWSQCGVQSCSSTERKPTYRSRQRVVLEEMGGFGLPCSHLSESQPCTPPPCFQWNTSILEECRPLDPVKLCGDGTQQISVTCLNKDGILVDDDRCLIFTRVHKPSSPTPCYLPCGQDCVISQWSDWSKCSQRCGDQDAGSIRKRTKIIYAKAGPGGKSCPSEGELEQVQLCPNPPECQTYIWQVSDWGRCLVTKRSLTCGVGLQTRSVQCYKKHGANMPNGSGADLEWVSPSEAIFRCSQKDKPEERRECSLPCPVNCHLSDWSNWTPCSASCRPAGSDVRVATQTRRRYVIEEGRDGGSVCSDILQDTRPCAPLPVCNHYHWMLSEWSPCVLPPYYIYCGEGLRARTVLCQDEGNNDTDPDFCLRSLGTIPATTEICMVTCDQDCRLSSWSAYGQCVGGCDGFRIRTRNLIGESKDKTVCRNQVKYPLVYKDICRCADFKPILVGDWSPCILDDAIRDEGIETKYEKIRKEETEKKEEGNDLASFFENLGRFDLTTASILETDNPEAARVEVSEKNKFDNTPRVDTVLHEQPLGDVPGRPVISRKRLCGIGTRYRLFICQSQKEPGVIETAYNCSSELYSEEMCMIPCPADCDMTVWSEWTPCSVSCGSGIQTRRRQILKHGIDGGRECPQITDGTEIEKRTCSSICSTNAWRIHDWGQCYAEGSSGMNKDVLCGVGVRTRKINCVKKSDYYSSSKDSAFFCRSEPRPLGRELCEIPCPGKCVVSQWSTWSQCSKDCSPGTFRKRTRQILRKPAFHRDGCLPLKEEESCIKGDNCNEYNWTVSDWSSCILDEKAGDCGVGWRRRYLSCQYTDAKRVDNFKCLQLYGSLDVRLMEACNKTCDVNCALSEWSPWTECDRQCGLGKVKRHRSVVYPAEGQGRKCPEEMEQIKSCFFKPCYKIVLSNWTDCQLKRGACGHSTLRRILQCLSEDGLPVHIDRCSDDIADLPTLETERACSIPCPGECVVSAWSNWSDCHINCRDFHQGDRKGTTSRSRVVLLEPAPDAPDCPPLWDYTTCVAEQCYSFFWRKSSWERGVREVWCSRGDGLNVTGGCDVSAQPADVLHCLPGCLTNHSVCVDTDLCGCKSPYSAIYDSQDPPRLLQCVMGLNGTKPSAAPALYYPADGLTNFWMYAVLAAGSLFIIFVIVALYTIWRRDQKQKQNVEMSLASGSGVSKTVKPGKSANGRSPDQSDGSHQEEPTENNLLSVPSTKKKTGRNGSVPIYASVSPKKKDSATASLELNNEHGPETSGNSVNQLAPTTTSGSVNQLSPETSSSQSPEETMPESSETSVLLPNTRDPLDDDSEHVVRVDIHAECNNTPATENSQNAPLTVTDDWESSGNSVDTGRGSSPTDRNSLDGAPTLPRSGLCSNDDHLDVKSPLINTKQSPTSPPKFLPLTQTYPSALPQNLRISVIPSRPANQPGDSAEDTETMSNRTFVECTAEDKAPVSNRPRVDSPKDTGKPDSPSNKETVTVIEDDSLDSDSDLPNSACSSIIKLPLADSKEDLKEMVTTV